MDQLSIYDTIVALTQHQVALQFYTFQFTSIPTKTFYLTAEVGFIFCPYHYYSV